MNILVINLKGGAAKTTNSSIIASYLPNSTLIEIDKINKSDSKIISKDYNSLQIDFLNESDDQFLNFENILLDDGIKIIDIGAVKLEVFHKAMSAANLYATINLLIIPGMDGADDFSVAMAYMNTIKNEINSKNILFSFNRFNEHEYTSPQEQFSSFFDKTDEILNNFKIDLNDDSNFYVLKDSRAIKLARANKITLKSLVETDVDAITKKQRSTQDKVKRMELTKQRSLILSSQNFYNEYVISMIQKITNKLEQ